MSDKTKQTLEQGAKAIVYATQTRDGDVNFHVLAMACGRRASKAEELADALEWTKAGIACYSAASEGMSDVVHGGTELSAFGLRARIILRFGTATFPDQVNYVEEIENWLKDSIREFASSSQFMTLLAGNITDDKGHCSALLLREKLQTIAPVWVRGLLQRDFDEWFRAAGFKENCS